MYIGLDFGTLSVRAVLVRDDGTVLSSEVCEYPHGVMSSALDDGTPLPEGYALADPRDYISCMKQAVRSAISKAGAAPGDIAGIGIDAANSSILPCRGDGNALLFSPDDPSGSRWDSCPHAYIKLWKHHGAKRQIRQIEALYHAGGLPLLARYGGSCSYVQGIQKLLETYEEAPEVFDAADRFCEVGDWIAWSLTGHPVASIYYLGFNNMWARDLGYPSRQDLDRLAPGFGNALYDKFFLPPSEFETPCGFLTEEAAEELGLIPGTPVATPMGDGNITGLVFCRAHPHAIVSVLGTSVATSFVMDRLVAMSGINGVVQDGYLTGKACYDAGSPCMGDMLDWFTKRQVPPDYAAAARAHQETLHEYLTELAAEKSPWNNPLTVLDWWNGSRSILNDPRLTGCVTGFSLTTQPEDVYGAMIQGCACSYRKALEHFEAQGAKFDEVILCGGIAQKNAFAVGQFASILRRPVLVPEWKESVAVGSAVLIQKAVCNGRSSIEDALNHHFREVLPDAGHGAQYEALYARWSRLHDLMAGHRDILEPEF